MVVSENGAYGAYCHTLPYPWNGAFNGDQWSFLMGKMMIISEPNSDLNAPRSIRPRPRPSPIPGGDTRKVQDSITLQPGAEIRKTYGCVWKWLVPLNPMVLLIIIPFLNGYFIGNILYFQTNPYGSNHAVTRCGCGRVSKDVLRGSQGWRMWFFHWSLL